MPPLPAAIPPSRHGVSSGIRCPRLRVHRPRYYSSLSTPSTTHILTPHLPIHTRSFFLIQPALGSITQLSPNNGKIQIQEYQIQNTEPSAARTHHPLSGRRRGAQLTLSPPASLQVPQHHRRPGPDAAPLTRPRHCRRTSVL